ncbi:MAG: 30S ribosomal protein S11 [Elusimicrobia bacterium]|nr:30S ribosomal protein S11 [Elusimicrobiota bacterium]
MAEENEKPAKETKPDADAKGRSGAPPSGDRGPRPSEGSRKKTWRSVSFGRVYIQCSFNNTIISLTDERGDVLAWSTAGANGFRGTKKGTPFAAGVTATRVAKRALELGVKQVAVYIRGPGPGRETAVRSLGGAGLIVVSLKDVSPLPHNGCRPPKARRV